MSCRRSMASTLALAGALAAGRASATGILYPSDRSPPPAAPAQPKTTDRADEEGGWPMHPWEAAPLDVEIVGTPPLAEERRIGDYGQPRWTARRRFPTTRIYVIPAGMVELEWWFRYAAPFDDPVEQRKLCSAWELSMGLGHRLQLDLYLQGEQRGRDGKFGMDTEKVELRWAFANWGVVWGNPTAYLEWIHRNAAPDKIEGKLLLGGGLARGWHGALNAVYEREVAGEGEGEMALSGGVSRTIVDSAVSLGLEAKVALVDFAGARWDFVEQKYLLGPSVVWNPVPPANVLFVPLFGVGRDAEKDQNRGVLEAWLVTGWAF
ncbi:MAG: hypothetical protein HY744_06720 [Deltaproteobacteria bacterium]|nr:hypothetical protein [Deltaproteobacteria bacterium]